METDPAPGIADGPALAADVLEIEHRGDVDWVTLNRPHRLNALDQALSGRLRSYFEDLAKGSSCRVVVLRGAGRGFCAGADLLDETTDVVRQQGLAAAMRVQRSIANIMLAMRRCPQPIVTLWHGVAVGGGLALGLASDIRIAARSTRLSAAFIKLGLGGCDMGSSYFLPRMIGAAAASQYLLTGLEIEPERALTLGLLAELVDADELEATASRYVDAMLATAPLGLAFTKDVINLNLHASSFEAALALEDRNQVLLSQTHDFAEGAAAFRERRPPTFTGR